jgi:hypothetical protein
MKKFACLLVICLMATSVNAVTTSPTAPADNGGLTVNYGVTPNSTHIEYDYGEAKQLSQNFVLNNNIGLQGFAFQLQSNGANTDNIYASSSWAANAVKMNIAVWQLNVPLAPQNQGQTASYNAGEAQAAGWTMLGQINDWPSACNSLNTTSDNKTEWLNFDLSSLNLNLTAGTQYAISVGWAPNAANHGLYLRVNLTDTSTTTGYPAAPAFAVSAAQANIPFTSGGGVYGDGFNGSVWTPGYGTLGGAQNTSMSMNYVVEAPEPATIAVLALGGLLLRRRSK